MEGNGVLDVGPSCLLALDVKGIGVDGWGGISLRVLCPYWVGYRLCCWTERGERIRS
jgi:hypothetical protein